MDDAVGYVSRGAAEKQRQSHGADRAAALAGHQHPRQNGDDHHGPADQRCTREQRRGIRQNTECDTRIATVH